MDKLIRQFIEKTPVHLLEEHRQLMRKYGPLICNNLVKLSLSGNQSSEDCILTGSIMEGALLARLFSPDSKISNEMELDAMTVLMEWPTEEGLKYVDSNKAFAHIVVDSEDMNRVKSSFGEDAIQKLSCEKEDGTYMNSQLTKAWFKELITQVPNFLDNLGFRPSIAVKECDAGSASIAVQMCDITDEEQVAEEPELCGSETVPSIERNYLREATKSANALEKHYKLVKEMIPHCEMFEIRIAEMFAHLRQLQDEFMRMRSEEVVMSLYSQTSKALEWAMTCVDITDLIFDTRQATAGRYLYEVMGWNTETTELEPREQLKQKLNIYIDQLAISENDISNASDAAAVCQLLSDIEREDIASNLILDGFREFAKKQEMVYKNITYAEQNRHLAEIPQPMQKLSGNMKITSFDFVPCFKLMFWPSAAVEWKTRDRVWPDQSVIEEIVSKGTYLIAKACCHDDIDWRLSFSVAELDLNSRWSPVQHFVYFIFKSLFYKFIKPLCAEISLKKYLASYIAKTVMMWTSESIEQSWWTEDNADECLTVLLLALQSAFQCRELDHYFVSSVNLLQGVPEVLASRVTETVNSILADPSSTVDQMEGHFQKTELFFKAMPAQI